MHKIKLTEYQLRSVINALSASYDQVEDAVLEKYNVAGVDQLNSTDFEEIMSDIQDWTWELNEKAR